MKAKGMAVGLLVLGLLFFGTVGPGPAVAATQEQPAPPEGMVLIPAGSFLMGDSFGEGWYDELPVHEVYVSAFYMDKYEVTKALWDEVASWAQDNGYDIKPYYASGKAPDHPAYAVSWFNAVKWANARSEKEGLTPVFYTNETLSTVYRTGWVNVMNEWVNWDADGYRLPTEAEWEKAARGGCEGQRFPWCDTNTIDHTRANYTSTYLFSYDMVQAPGYRYHPTYATGWPCTSPVGSFAPNGYGLYDMAGNVNEWCWDWWRDSTYHYTVSPVTNPRGPSWGIHRVLRGGGWYNFAFYCRVSYRDLSTIHENVTLGFRLVRTAP